MPDQATVLVTGGAGYAGSVLVPRLLAAGWQVRVLDLLLFGADSLPPAGSRLTVIEGDTRDGAAVAAAVAGCDCVIHLAGISDRASFDLDPEVGRSVNLRGLDCVLGQSLRAGVRGMLYVSSTDVYGGSGPALDERHPLTPDAPHAICLAIAEELVWRASAQGLPATIFRAAPLHGPSPRPRFDLPVNQLAARAHCLKEIPAGLLRQSLTGVHVADLADLLCAALQWPGDLTLSEVYNVADLTSPEGLRKSLEELVPSDPGAVPVLEANIASGVTATRIAREIGWQPRRDAAASVRELAALLRDGRITGPLSEPRFHNVEALRLRSPGDLRRAA